MGQPWPCRRFGDISLRRRAPRQVARQPPACSGGDACSIGSDHGAADRDLRQRHRRQHPLQGADPPARGAAGARVAGRGSGRQCAGRDLSIRTAPSPAFAELFGLDGIDIAGDLCPATSSGSAAASSAATAAPLTELADSSARSVFVAAFDAERLTAQLAAYLPERRADSQPRRDAHPGRSADQPPRLSRPAQLRDQFRAFSATPTAAHPAGHGELLVGLRRAER